MPKKQPVWGMVLDASSSIDELFAKMDSGMKSYGTFGRWSENHFRLEPYPGDGETFTAAWSEWRSYAWFKNAAIKPEDIADSIEVHALGNTADQGTSGQNRTLTYRSKFIEKVDNLTYSEWVLSRSESKVGMLQLFDTDATGDWISRDILWSGKAGGDSALSYYAPTKKNLLNHVGKEVDLEDDTMHVFLITGNKRVSLGGGDDIVSTFFPQHNWENNGYTPDEIDLSPTGRYKGGSVIDGGDGFDRLIYDDGEYFHNFNQVPRSDAQKFMRGDFEISVVGNPLKGVFQVTNTKFGWTDKIKNIEELEFAIPSENDPTASVTIGIRSPFTHLDDTFDFNGKLAELQDKAKLGMTFNMSGGGNDVVQLPTDFAVLVDGSIDPSGNSNNFRAGSGKDVITGGGQQDFIRGGGADDVINGDPDFEKTGSDKLFGQGGDDYLAGGGDNDWLSGGPGNDYLTGDLGKDFLEGGKDDDKLIGGLGNDKLKGGKGSDTFVFTHSFAHNGDQTEKFGRDTILDFQATGPRSKQDHIEFWKLVGEVETFREFKAASTQKGKNVIYDADDDGINQIVFRNLDLDDLSAFNFDYV
ncbi:calcium-binding protein [Chachezhania sediminis]|uniref:calcium-binding protein n=1 Tax=Chachezhania sediminis TaxID=2599291 RepID=UPI00131A8650|nr:calcium-binding protein [Chachezhania sediminis]